MPKVQGVNGAMRATDLARTPAQEAQAPESPAYGGTKNWESLSKKRGISALRIKTDRESPISKDRAIGVNREL